MVPKIDNNEDKLALSLVAHKAKHNQKTLNNLKKDNLLSLETILEPEELKTIMQNLCFEVDNEIRCQIMERIVQMVVEGEIGSESFPILTDCLSNILSTEITADIFPTDDPNDEALSDSISTPLFVMFRNHFQLCKEEDIRKKLLSRVLADLQSVQPRIGYLLLYFLKIWCKEEDKLEGGLRFV